MSFDYYNQDSLYSYYDKRISELIALGRKREAQDIAFEWLLEFEGALCILIPWNWKIAKKQIVKHCFNTGNTIDLLYNDNIDKAIDFIKRHAKQKIRGSFHIYDTACHSESRRIQLSDLSWLYQIKAKMSERDVISLFIESSSPTTICFRRISDQYNIHWSYEVAYGQAMYAFEAERGQHDIAGIDRYGETISRFPARDSLLTTHLDRLIAFQEQYLAIKTHCLCYFMGIPYISVEGYFDLAKPNEKPIIVDIDLPFDRVFFEI